MRSHGNRTAQSEQKQFTSAFVPEGCQKLVLERADISAAFETSLGLPVGTVTFFDFQDSDFASCEKHLKDKFRSVVKANPWMVCASHCLTCCVRCSQAAPVHTRSSGKHLSRVVKLQCCSSTDAHRLITAAKMSRASP